MSTEEYYRKLMAVNSANLAANIENLEINEEMLKRTKGTDEIVGLLTRILEVLDRGCK